MNRRDDGLVIRAGTAGDLPEILGLLAAAMSRDTADDRFEALYRWKHEENAFGASPAWVMVDPENDGRIAGVRVFMRWEFVVGGEVRRAVRAVDTATHPDYQGRGIFTRLTMHALESVRDEGVHFVFNTPNDQSRPGYLKMGWEQVGRLPIACRPRSPLALARMIAARVPAERWSLETDLGLPVDEALADTEALASLLASRPAFAALRTNASARFLRWRYGTPLLHYRALVGTGGVADGLALFRVRRRGAAREVVLADVVAPGDDPRRRRSLTRAVARLGAGDYVLRLGGPAVSADGFVRLPRQGPILTRRAVNAEAPADLRSWSLTLGDVELF